MATSESVPGGLIKSLNLVKIAEATYKLDDNKLRQKQVNVVMKDQAPSGFIVASGTEVRMSQVYSDFKMEDQAWAFTNDLTDAVCLMNEKN